MDLFEYQARDMFEKHGVPVLRGIVATTAEEAAEAARELLPEQGGVVVVKAQVKTGGRGKAGGVKIARSPEEAGEKAAEIVGNLGRSPAAPADMSNASEEQARANFQSEQGMFMVNWPYVLAAARTAAEEGTLPQAVVDDIGWARYPRVSSDRPSAPPLGGANLGIGTGVGRPFAQQNQRFLGFFEQFKRTGYCIWRGELAGRWVYNLD